MTGRHLAVVGFLGLVCATIHAQVPQLLSYQGRVVVSSTNFNGTGQFKFALMNNANGQTLWSNDNSSTNGTEPSSAVSLSVANGLYSVLLGDASITNMTAIPFTVFNNSDVRLRVWFNDGSHGFQLLSPDQRLASVGYAVIANNVVDGSISSAKLAPNAVTSAKIDPTTVQQRITGSAPNGQYVKSINADGTVVTAVDANSGGTVTSVTAGTGLSGGTITNSGTLAVDSTIPRLGNTQTFTALNTFAGGLTFTSDQNGITFPSAGATNVPMIKMFAGGTSNADRMVIAHSTSFPSFGLQYQDSSDTFRFLAGGTSVMSIGLGSSIGVGIGTDTPQGPFDVGGGNFIVKNSGFVGIGTIIPGERLELLGPDAAMRIHNSNDPSGGVIEDTFSALQLGMFNPTGAVVGVLAAGEKRAMFGMNASGKVGSLTNDFGNPVYRNVVDDGNGLMNVGGVLNAPLGTLLYHASFQGMASYTALQGGGIVGLGDGLCFLALNSSIANSSAEVTMGDATSSPQYVDATKVGTFLSARVRWEPVATRTSSDVFYAMTGARTLRGFGFKAIGNALKGVVVANSVEAAAVDLATDLSSNSFVNVLAIRRAASMEFYVNGVLKGTSATVPDSGLFMLYDVYLTNGSGTHDVRADITFFTIGTPMF